MTEEERDRVVAALVATEAAFVDCLRGLTGEQWSYKAAPDEWSIAQTAEHMVRAESMVLDTLQRALAAPADPDWEAKTAGKTRLLERAIPSRSRKVQAPEQILPRGWSSDEVIAGFLDARARTLRFARETTAALECHTAEHPFRVFGALNCYQWLLYIPLHHERHARQISEIQGSEGYPR